MLTDQVVPLAEVSAHVEQERPPVVDEQLLVAGANRELLACADDAPEERPLDDRRRAARESERCSCRRAPRSVGIVAPAAARIDARQVHRHRRPAAKPCSAGMWPGQRTIAGTRMPPSHRLDLWWKSGMLRDSHSPPLSFVKMTIVLPRQAEAVERTQDLADAAVGALEHRHVFGARARRPNRTV